MQTHMDKYVQKAREVIDKVQKLYIDEPLSKKNQYLTEIYISILKSDLVPFKFFFEIYQKFELILYEDNAFLQIYNPEFYIKQEDFTPEEYIDFFWREGVSSHPMFDISQPVYFKNLIHDIEFINKYFQQMEQSNSKWVNCILQNSQVAFEFFTNNIDIIIFWDLYKLNPSMTSEKLLFLINNHNIELDFIDIFTDYKNINLEIITHPIFLEEYRQHRFLAIQPYITSEFILENLDDWNFNITGLLCNPNISWDFLKTHFPEKIKNNTKWKSDVNSIFDTVSPYFSMDNITQKKIKLQLKSKFKDISEIDIDEFNLTEFISEVCNYTPPPKNERPQHFGVAIDNEIFRFGNFTSEQFIQLIEDNKTKYHIKQMIDSLFENKNITMTTITKVVKNYPDYINSGCYSNIYLQITILQRPDMTFEMVDLMLNRIMKNSDTMKFNLHVLCTILEKIMNDEFYITNLARLHNAAFRIQNRYLNALVIPYTELGIRKINRDYDFFANGFHKLN